MTKFLAVATLSNGDRVTCCAVFDRSLGVNEGVSFGLFANGSSASSCCQRSGLTCRQRLGVRNPGSIIGGAVSNIADRSDLEPSLTISTSTPGLSLAAFNFANAALW